MAQINPPNEYPDNVGTVPDNPILAAFRPFIPTSARLRELTMLLASISNAQIHSAA